MKKFEGMTDEALALLYVGGDNKAFDELLSRTQEKLFTYIMFVVRDHDTAYPLDENGSWVRIPKPSLIGGLIRVLSGPIFKK